ncbi:MAG: NarK/NasA family nitrate transporter [Armatimonadetes bacterium]|nr:NarK/NasA family nitrate transporter [Armatimonadota bacterium]
MTGVIDALLRRVKNLAVSTRSPANRILFMNTLAFTVCFAVWMMNGVLVTFMVDNGLLTLDKAQIGWLIGIPVLTGAILRLPVGIMADKYGGKPVYIGVMLITAAACFLLSFMQSFAGLFVAGLAFGLAGTSFAVGIAYTSVWFPKERQGTVLGIFGVGNAGAAITAFGAPLLLRNLTDNGANPENWKYLPMIYGLALIVMTVLFALFTTNKKPEGAAGKTLKQRLEPLKDIRVWRFGYYYFLVFGGFVALSQWLVPYYLNVYTMSLATAGMMASIFILPSGAIRALGGWCADRFGARATMYWVLSACVVFFLLIVAPRMDISSPGEGILAAQPGTVTAVTDTSVTIGDKTYELEPKPAEETGVEKEGALVFPTFESWQEPAVSVGDQVTKKQLIAKGLTHVYFQANVWIFTVLLLFAGIAMGVGSAAVYRHIPDYFPRDVGVVGGLVGVLGGLGGFVCPIIFGYMLKGTGVWTTCWLFLALISIVAFVWMHTVILKISRDARPTGPMDDPSRTPTEPNGNGATN